MPLEAGELELIERMRALTGRFAERAAKYDQEAVSQAEDFRELHAAGLMGITIPKRFGGLGLNYWEKPNQLVRWLLIKEIAKADLALARNWESHINAVEILALAASEQQQCDVFELILQNGAVISNWATDSPPPGMAWRPTILNQTVAYRAEGGWQLNGVKRYANTARLANPVIIWAVQDGAGEDFRKALMAFIVHIGKNEGLTIEPWWDSMGMRAADVQRVRLDNLFVPDEDVAGNPGALAAIPLFDVRHLPSYSSSFVGAAEAILEFTIAYTGERNKHHSPHLQYRIGQMRESVETANMWMRQLADTWQSGDADAIRAASMLYRSISAQCALAVANHATVACGSTAFQKSFPFERMFRDLQVYVLHGDPDTSTANIGALTLAGTSNNLWTQSSN